MNEIIKELENKKSHELFQVGLTPRTNFKGTQTEHDLHHKKKAESYQEAINILNENWLPKEWRV